MLEHGKDGRGAGRRLVMTVASQRVVAQDERASRTRPTASLTLFRSHQ